MPRFPPQRFSQGTRHDPHDGDGNPDYVLPPPVLPDSPESRRGWLYIRNTGAPRPPVMPNCDDGVSKQLWLQAGFAERLKPAEELYDLMFDPMERNNLAGDPCLAPVLAALRARLRTWMEESRDPLLNPDPSGLPPYQVNPLSELHPSTPTQVWDPALIAAAEFPGPLEGGMPEEDGSGETAKVVPADAPACLYGKMFKTPAEKQRGPSFLPDSSVEVNRYLSQFRIQSVLFAYFRFFSLLRYRLFCK